MDEGASLEGKVVECKYCNHQWIYETKTKYLENRLAELNQDLDNTEVKINLKKKEHQDKINQLENNLKTKKEELQYQKELQEKVAAFENRLKETEKLNSEEMKLDNKITKIKKEIRSTVEDISNQNKDIEDKTNYLETKINSYNHEDFKKYDHSQKEEKNQVHNSEVVDINKNVNKTAQKAEDQQNENKKIKKIKFFSPNFLK
tara:strand:+ start:236 stop:844 length:609 start_codon:yes stop_codon:yes gene_type:complete